MNGKDNIVSTKYNYEINGILKNENNSELIQIYQTFKVLDKAINDFIEKDIKPVINLTVFDTWFNLALSIKPEYDFGEDFRKVTGSFSQIELSKFDSVIINTLNLLSLKLNE